MDLEIRHLRLRPGGLVVRRLAETGANVVGGAATGVLVFFAFSRLLGGLLYQTNVADVRVTTAATLLIASAAIAVAFLQARRLARVSPIVALRDETA